MKQHITVEQLKRLSSEGHIKLDNWWKPQLGDLYIVWDFPDSPQVFTEERFYVTGSVSPLLSIGIMIEFLEEQMSLSLGEWLDMPKRRGKVCDALWEAVKEVLEK